MLLCNSVHELQQQIFAYIFLWWCSILHLNFSTVSKTWMFAARLSKNESGAYVVSARFVKQHITDDISMVNPIIDYSIIIPQFSSLVDWPMHKKRRFNLHLMNAKDQLFLHNGLRANTFSTPVSAADAVPACIIQNPRIKNDCCDKQQPRGFLGQWIKISLECPCVSCMQSSTIV
jgi:hypothetical protein